MVDRLRLARLIGRHLESERRSRGWSQEDLAARVGTSQSWLSRVERGRIAAATWRVEELFAAMRLQLRVEVEPLGTNLNSEAEKVAAMTDEERVDEIAASVLFLRPVRHLRYVITGRLAAFAQGAPVTFDHVDLAVVEEDLDGYAEAFEKHGCQRWSVNWNDWGWGEHDPRTPGPQRWLLMNTLDVRLQVLNRLPPSITVHSGGEALDVAPLADLETAFPDIGRVMADWRRRPVTGG